MTDEPREPGRDRAPSSATAPPSWPGLCGRCRHARTVTSARGSRFLRCELAAHDARYAKYPALPVGRCEGHAPGEVSR